MQTGGEGDMANRGIFFGLGRAHQPRQSVARHQTGLSARIRKFRGLVAGGPCVPMTSVRQHVLVRSAHFCFVTGRGGCSMVDCRHAILVILDIGS